MLKKNTKPNGKELRYIPVLKQIIKKSLSQRAAAVKLNISERQVIRLIARFRENGNVGIIHRGRNKRSPRKLPQDKIDEILCLIEMHYRDYNTLHVAELLQERHGITINSQRLRRLRGGRLKKIKTEQHRERRERRAYYGEMMQIDGCLHDWFEKRAPKTTLICCIDDATSKIMYLRFVKGESTKNLMVTLCLVIEMHGKPLSLYADRGSAYKVSKNNPDKLLKTQLERALQVFDIELIHAYSPQAKGRVERAFLTLQDRLVKELRQNNIASLSAGNKFLLEQFLPKYAKKWAHPPAKAGNMHRPLVPHEKLDEVFVIEQKRILQNDFTISYRTRLFQLTKEQPTPLFPKNVIIVREKLDSTISLFIRSERLNFIEITKRPEKSAKMAKKKSGNLWFPHEDSLFYGLPQKFN